MLTKEQAQQKLNLIGPLREFTVVFTKRNGETRKITGFMEPLKGEPKPNVSIKCTQGDDAGEYKSFLLDKVIDISYQD